MFVEVHNDTICGFKVQVGSTVNINADNYELYWPMVFTERPKHGKFAKVQIIGRKRTLEGELTFDSQEAFYCEHIKVLEL
ncbi:hypothetical protein KNT64_gp052 [Pseudomonas phage PspYZU05]|uniref:Uncharacterized protein n=1 Tax=Pseudomonas phage PspYZU05 TaxID=1983556 RepID=A0A2U7NJG4_9CAUD|nr:hypothetical protein KNT64_gp052 [Pseudomonas phage PspYZU05]ASD52004.1 hypothetical protein PspYZU05_52 [Pseudomonas phage PspYZU05]